MTPTKKAVPKTTKEVEPEESQEKEQLYVLKTRKVDAFSTLADYVPLEGDMCPICGFSVCEVNHLPKYDRLDDMQRARVDGTLESHLGRHLPTDQVSTIPESKLPTQWLKKASKVGD